MDDQLTTIELRVLGVLIEKQISTPDYYPMTLNALVNACNQKNNRDPVVTWDAMTVELGLDSLRGHNLVRKIIDDGGRTPKFAHLFIAHYDLTRAQAAIMCELMLRGPQTPGELKTRTARLHNFDTLDDVEKTIESLVSRQPQPLAAEQPRQPGTRETRFMHLLGEHATPALAIEGDDEGKPYVTAEQLQSAAPPASSPHGVLERLANLEGQVASLATTASDLMRTVAELRTEIEAIRQSPVFNPSRIPPLIRKQD